VGLPPCIKSKTVRPEPYSRRCLPPGSATFAERYSLDVPASDSVTTSNSAASPCPAQKELPMTRRGDGRHHRAARCRFRELVTSISLSRTVFPSGGVVAGTDDAVEPNTVGNTGSSDKAIGQPFTFNEAKAQKALEAWGVEFLEDKGFDRAGPSGSANSPSSIGRLRTQP
jgi:hypothetical protein